MSRRNDPVITSTTLTCVMARVREGCCRAEADAINKMTMMRLTIVCNTAVSITCFGPGGGPAINWYKLVGYSQIRWAQEGPICL